MTLSDERPLILPPLLSSPAAAATHARIRHRELAVFLRSRRERLSPAEVGLPDFGRRRTPGLRREEVASLAGVSITWYTWLEQGRDINPSEAVLDAVARTLLLDAHERYHLFTLAGVAPPSAPEDACITPELRVVLDRLEPFPAFVSNARYDLLAYNHAYQTTVIGDLDALPPEERNSLWLMFTTHTTSKCFVDGATTKPRLVAQLRSAMAEHVADPAWKCLVRRLREASPEFEALWQRHDVAPPENTTKNLLHPVYGLLQFHYVNTWLAPRIGHRLVVYVPADEATAGAITQARGAVPLPIC